MSWRATSGGSDLARQRHRTGFTLIEMIAVTLLFAVISGIFAPQIGLLSSRALGNLANDLTAHIELGRQRAVVTGTPHRIVMDLEAGGYRLQWRVTELEAMGAEAEAPPPLDIHGQTPIAMAPPRELELDFHPVPGTAGDFVWLEQDLFFAGLETQEGWFDRGEAAVVFRADGTATGARIHLEDADGKGLVLEILPLSDSVRIIDAEEI